MITDSPASLQRHADPVQRQAARLARRNGRGLRRHDRLELRLARGEAYVFVKSHSGWSGGHTETAKLTAANGHPGDWFGLAVAVSGGTTVVDDKPLSGPRPDGIPIDPANPAGKPRHPDRVKWPSTCTILRSAGRAYADAAALASSEYLG